MQQDATVQSYQQFPAQAARIPTSHSQLQLDLLQQTQANGSPLTRPNSNLTSPHMSGLTREASWPLEAFSDLHLSASEPRIFPGVVSRTQRRDSTVRKSSMSETDDVHSAGTSRKSGKRKALDGAVEEELEKDDYEEEQESDGDMEEAGGRDEQY